MYRAKRVKRDSAENIYRQCKIAGTCPPDVENKIENNTLADRLLKIFGGIIYLGGLGIGTGSGTGFRPLPDVTPPITDTVPTAELPVAEIPLRPTVRPTKPPSTFGVPLDPISSVDNVPRIVRPEGPSIVPLNEGLPDPSSFGPISGGNAEVLTYIDALEDVEYVGSHPTIITTRTDIAVLDVTPSEAPLRRVHFEINSTEPEVTIIETAAPHISDLNVFVDPSYSGVHIGEEIELQPINRINEFEIEEALPSTSTPSQIIQRTIGRARQLYNRFTEQAETRNLDFLGQPSRAVQFEFENPAFTPEVTLTFERDLAEVAAAPDPTFTDVVLLERPQFSRSNENLVRYSRLGTRAKTSTRSGNILRQKVHFFYDLSPISAVDQSIEMQVLDEASDNLTVVDELINTSSTYINPIFESYNEQDLVDELTETFENAHLIVATDENEDLVSVPGFPVSNLPKVYIDDYSKGVLVDYPSETSPTLIEPASTIPNVYVSEEGLDFILHPSWFRRRKRKYSEIF